MTPAEAENLRRRAAAWSLAEQREIAERRKAGPDCAAAIAGALELIDLFDRLHGWPPPEDELRRREDEAARESWRRVRAHYLAHG
ncbi:MAG TPA: hypothetical protein VEG34_16970 [Thermoanaerobaculia bacterium]|nr:hypothetical protein [Thermoanaerobaculia bacterium]